MQPSSPEPIAKIHGVEITFLRTYPRHLVWIDPSISLHACQHKTVSIGVFLLRKPRRFRSSVVLELTTRDFNRWRNRPTFVEVVEGYTLPKDLGLSKDQFDEIAEFCLAHHNLLQ